MIVIAGGGIVGLATALQLAKTGGLNITLLQGDAPDFSYSETLLPHRVSALTASSVALLQSLNVWPRIVSRRVFPLKSMAVFAESPRCQLRFSHQQLHADQLGYIVENDLIVHALWEEIAETNLISCVKESFAAAHVDGTQVHVFTNKRQQFLADLVVAADGSDSFVRTFFKMNASEKDYRQHAITACIETDKPHLGHAVQHFYSDEILGFLPIHPANSYSLVWSLSTEQAKKELEKSDDEFIRDLTERMHHQVGNIISIGPRHAFPLKRQHADRYCQTGVVLLGDALHRVHPLAGQGINLAFKDIGVLSEVIQRKKKNYALGDMHTLRAFERRAKSAHMPMCVAIDVLKTVFSAPSWVKQCVLSPGLMALNSSSFLKTYFIRQAM